MSRAKIQMEPSNDPLCHSISVLSRCSDSVSLIAGCQDNNVADILLFHDRGWDQTGSNGASMYFLSHSRFLDC